MRLSDFDFELPSGSIAQHPVSPRDSARLLVVRDGVADHAVRDLPQLLRPGDLLVVNDTRALPVRLAGRRGELAVSVTLHGDCGAGQWAAFVKPGRRVRVGDRIAFADDFAAELVEKRSRGDVILRFDVAGAEFAALLRRHGAMPLPPYIRRAVADDRDQGDYQTMFAARDGAVAAPTAGLHFTPELLRVLEARGIGCTRVTLHVGAGTFSPVRVEDLRDHRMQAEWGSLDATAATAINRAKDAGGRIVAVGTTCVRLLECAVDDSGAMRQFHGETDLFITPGWRFHAVDLMMTNFHLPKSTLFVLVCAFAGAARMRAAYAHAMASGYRFYSYGDSCLLSPDRGAS